MLLRPLPHLTMDLGALPVFDQEVLVHTVGEALFFVRRSKGVFIRILDALACRIGGIGEQVRNWNPRWVALRCREGAGFFPPRFSLYFGLARSMVRR